MKHIASSGRLDKEMILKNIKKDKIYLYEGNEKLFLDAFLVEDDLNVDIRPAVIVCPGGGYLTVGTSEGAPVANRFCEDGYNVFVLNYSILDDAKFDEDNSELFAPVKDLEKAVEYLINNAEVLKIDVDKISIAAFSAGGHLAARYVMQNKNVSDKIKALILVYPMLDFRYKIGPAEAMEDVFQTDLFKTVSQQVFGEFPPKESAICQFSNHQFLASMDTEDVCKMPPMFIYHAENDKIVSFSSSKYFIQILAAKGADFDTYFTPSGEHANPFYDPEWFDEALKWLKDKLA